MRNRVRILGLASGGMLILAAAAPAALADVDIYIAGGTDGFNTQSDLDQWNKLHPDIHIHNISADPAKVATMVAAGDAPDLMRIESRFVPVYAHQGMLEDLDPYMKASPDYFQTDNMVMPIENVDVVDGKQYALDKDWSADMTLWYNKALFGNAGLADLSPTTPISYDTLMQISHKLTKQDANGTYTQWGFNGASYAYIAYQTMLYSAGQPFYSADGQSLDLADNPVAVAAAQWWATMAQRQWFDYGVAGDPWHEGKQGIVQYGYWFGPEAQVGATPTGGDQKVEGNKQIGLGFAPAPVYSKIRVDMPVATSFAMLAGSKHKKEAWEVLEWFMMGPPSIARTKIGWGLPSRRDYMQYVPQATAIDRQRYQVTLGELPYLQPQFQNAYNESVFGDTWTADFGQLASNKLSTADWLRQVDKTVTVALQQAAAADQQ